MSTPEQNEAWKRNSEKLNNARLEVKRKGIMTLRECMEDEETLTTKTYWRAWRFGWMWGAICMLAYCLFAGCEILPSSKPLASYGTGPMAIEYLQHSTTATRGIVVIEVAGFTRGAYHLWVQTRSRSQTNGPGAWLTPSGSVTTVEVLFVRDRSGAPDVVTIVIQNDFDAMAPEYSRAVIEVSYQ